MESHKISNSRSALQYYRTDPNNKNRGAGFYYNRTWKNEGFSTKYMSKYDSKRDYYLKGEHKVGGSRKFAHFTDNPKKAGAEIIPHRNKLSSDGKYYDTQKHLNYSRNKTERYLQHKVGLKRYNEGKKSVKKYKSSIKSKFSNKKKK